MSLRLSLLRLSLSVVAAARRSRGTVVALVALAVTLPALHAAAVEPSDSDKEAARDLMFDGDRAFREGNFARALARYSTAYRLVQVPSVGIEVARSQLALGQLRSAYRSALAIGELAKAPAENPVIVRARADAATLASELRERIPTLRITVMPSSAHARIAIDGVVLEAASPSGLWLDPGKHRLTVSAPGFQAAAQELELVEREKRVLSVQLEPEKSATVTGLELARSQLARGQLRSAYRSALAVVELAKRTDEPPASLQARSDAATLAEDVRKRIPMLRLDILPGSAAASVAIDGVIMPSDTARRGLWLDPGKHRVSVSAPGFQTAQLELDLLQREKRVLPIELAPGPARPTGAAQASGSDQ